MSTFSIRSSELGDMMATLRNSFPNLWSRIVSESDSRPDPDRMRNVASLDSDFDKNKQYNGVQLIQIIYEKRDTYMELIQQPIAEPEPAPVAVPVPVTEPEPAVPRYAIESNQCAATLEAESLERLRVVVELNFSTIRGLVLLESDLALYADTENGAPDPEKWLEKMRTDWESRLHSEWLDEFMEALQLWVLSKI